MSESANYRIIQTVASGGTAVLYKAIQVSLDRVVAIKRLHQHLTTDDNFTRRFVLEARAAASLDHENIVRVIDFGVENDCYQMVMEYVEGESLRDVLERWRPVNPDLSLALAHQICRGLEHAHARGIVHRDIKPGNIMITRGGTVKIADFGLAKLTQGTSTNTAADSILGTPLYMSPEQAFGESVDQRSDLFSLGTVLYELLTGRQPFAGENYMGVIQNIIGKKVPGIRELDPSVPEAAEAIVARALARDRNERFQSAREFREAIEQVLGLEELNRALSALPVLLERNADTRRIRVSPSHSTTSSVGWRRSPSSAMAGGAERKRSLRVIAGVAVVACAVAGWFVLGPGVIPLGTPAPPERDAIQRSEFGNDWSSEMIDRPTTQPPGIPGAIDAASIVAADTAAAPREPSPEATAAVPPAGPSEPEKEPVTAETGSEGQSAGAVKQETAPAPARAEEPERFHEGYLLLNVDPSAQVYVNGVYRGLANPRLRLTLNAGTHSVECRSERHETYTETLRIIAGETSQRNVIMRKLKGIISLATNEGAEFYVDGVLIGVAPIMRPIEVDAGTHTLTISKENHFTWSSEVTVEPNVTLPLRITLSPRY